MTDNNEITFHTIGPDGEKSYILRIGEDIPVEMSSSLIDEETKSIYGLTYYENGEIRTVAVRKEIWKQAKASFEQIDQEAEVAHENVLRALEMAQDGGASEGTINRQEKHQSEQSSAVSYNQDIFFQINLALSRYIEIHDTIFSNSIRNILPIPFLFRPIAFRELDEKLGIIHEELQRIACLSDNFLPPLPEYLKALSAAILFLKRICNKLSLKAQNLCAYKLGVYREDMKTYKRLIQNYTELGPAVNELYAKLLAEESFQKPH